MPAVNPRVSVVLAPAVAETLRRVAAVNKTSMSKVVSELVTEMEPGLRQVADIGEMIGDLDASRVASMRQVVADLDGELAEPIKAGLAAMAEMSQAVDRVRSEVSAPPPGNTGVR